jgi:hypothetical protein
MTENLVAIPLKPNRRFVNAIHEECRSLVVWKIIMALEQPLFPRQMNAPVEVNEQLDNAIALTRSQEFVPFAVGPTYFVTRMALTHFETPQSCWIR